ncbi:N-glycosylase [Candidatus Pacearchaeota archaeon ex4484_71]|nr:MAG: N-glycosylase [Candidatus Pacearchaeota archaeon ex4484_71]
MKGVIKKLKKLQKSEVKKLIDKRTKEFYKKGRKLDEEEIFSELCFCILTANFQAKKSWEIQNKIGGGFANWSKRKLQKFLKKEGHRFWTQRAERIILARKLKKELIKKLKNGKNGKIIRNWLAENFKGIGMKEASHFLRNVGYQDVAIIDKHILSLLKKEKIIGPPKSLSKNKYLEIEKILEKISKKVSIPLGTLDLYLWFQETGKVLK